MGAHTKSYIIRKRRGRKEKIAKLRQRYLQSTSEAERQKLVAKAKRLSPLLTLEEFAKQPAAKAQ